MWFLFFFFLTFSFFFLFYFTWYKLSSFLKQNYAYISLFEVINNLLEAVFKQPKTCFNNEIQILLNMDFAFKFLRWAIACLWTWHNHCHLGTHTLSWFLLAYISLYFSWYDFMIDRILNWLPGIFNEIFQWSLVKIARIVITCSFHCNNICWMAWEEVWTLGWGLMFIHLSRDMLIAWKKKNLV